MAAEPSPAHTPLTPPPGVQPNGTVNAPPPTPDESAPLPPEPFAEELPPDFWGDDPIIPEAPQHSRERHVDDAPADSFTRSETSRAQAKPLTGPLKSDPRFVLLTELFPGQITDWQSAEAAAAPAPDNADGETETVDLERGLDADEPD